MALQIWMPFTDGTLKQQGLKDVSPTIGGTVDLTSVGKLGKCATIGTAAGGITLPASSMTSFTECSIAFWIKIISWNTSYATFFQAGLGSTPWNNYIFGILRNNAGSNLCFTLTNSSGTSSSAAYTTSNLNTGQWYHLAFTYKAGTISIYRDGVLDKTYSTTYVPNFAGITHISIGRSTNNSGYQTNCNLNDFRIYDHCLSAMEVKQLSQGLILHYPLNRQGFGQENLMPNSVEMPVGSANPSTGTWRLAGSSQMTRSRVAISDAPTGASTHGFQSVGLQTGQDASCWGIDGFPRENGTTYTLSAWGRIVGGSTTAAMLGFSVYSGTTLDYGGTYGQAKSSDTEYYGSGAYDYAGGRLNSNGNWTRIYRTFTSTSTSDNIYVGFNTAKTGNNVTLQLCGVKLEKGEKMTPWVPNVNESMYITLNLNGTTEYDCSGFCNNGIRNKIFTWSSDTPKYAVSQNFNNNHLIEAEGLPVETNTIACWIKWHTLPSGYTIPIHDKQSGLAIGITGKTRLISYVGTTSGGTGSCVNVSLETNVWYHIVVVKTGTTTRKVYINGEEITSMASNNWWGGDLNKFLVGGRHVSGNYSNYIDGQICDVRAYATALSAEDVKSLYQNCATIDPDGTIRGQIRS